MSDVIAPLAPRRARPVRMIDLAFPRQAQRPARVAKVLISDRDGDPTGLPAAKLGARWSIRWVDLMAWYEAHTTPNH